ncbi:putative peptidoglycan lipid II flippase [Desulfitispora alkaliphila]|uniref:murein biosynthesis integral membrane protein MurJ n=1 Tax=Desulfitispora alkaliphila TaxID=622674 RepID=UPI003D1BCCCC
MTTGEKIARAAGAVVIMNLFSRLLGFGREMAIADRFGASEAVDAYLVAYTIPYFLQAILGAALVTAAVPVFTKYIVDDNREEAWKVASILINITGVLLIAFTLVGILGSTQLVKLMAPGFNPETTALASHMTKIMFPAVIFMGVGMLLTGILNAFHYFALPAFAPGFSNLVIIATVVLLGAQYGIEGLAVGTLVSMLGFLIIQYPLLRKLNFKYTFSFDYKHPAVKKVGYTIMPIVIGVAVNQVYFAINRIFASGLVEGSISALNYSQRLMQLPLGIFVVAVSTAIFPALAAQAIKNQRFELGQTLIRGLRLVTLVSIPAAVGLIVLAEPTVKLLFERGAFDHRATVMTAQALIFYSIGMFAQGANLVITRAYYALDDVKTPVIMSLISVAVNIALSFALIGSMAHAGLALANSVAATVNTVLLYLYLRKHLEAIPHKRLALSFAKVSLASAIMAYLTIKAFEIIPGHLVLQVGGAIGVGVAVFGGTVLLLKEEEVLRIVEQIKNKILPK